MNDPYGCKRDFRIGIVAIAVLLIISALIIFLPQP